MRPELECVVQVLSRLQYAARFRSSPRTPENGANDEGTLHEKKGGDEVACGAPGKYAVYQVQARDFGADSGGQCQHWEADLNVGQQGRDCQGFGDRLALLQVYACWTALCVSVSVSVRLCLCLCLHLHLCQHLRLTLRLTVSMCLLELVT